jgi:geranylgeranyl pyrophosphate synthase
LRNRTRLIELDNSKNLINKDLSSLLQDRSKNVLSRFGFTINQGITIPELNQMLTNVNRYWKDTLRPSLTSLCCEAVGGPQNVTHNASLMVTLISAGMGIHDDIIDKSTNKHFRRTLSGLWGTDKAIVVGDLLIVKALSAIRELAKQVDPTKSDSIISAYEAAFVEMCEGELIEIASRKKLDTTLEQCNSFLWKFGADTEVCAKIGATLGNGSQEQVDALAQFGRRLGYSFRIGGELKDCLNIEGNLPERLLNESVPLPILFASRSSKENHQKIEVILSNHKISSSDIKAILELCFATNAFDYIKNISRQNTDEAKKMLTALSPSNAQSALTSLLDQYMKDIESLCL